MSRTLLVPVCVAAALAVGTLPTPAAAQAPDLHVIIVADTDDAIGPGCYQDLVAVQTLFEKHRPPNRTTAVKVFAGGNKNFAGVAFNGPNNFNQAAVLDYLKQIPLGPSTGVLVYFSGHGDYTTREGHRIVLPGTYLADQKNRLPNEAVLQVIADRKQPVRMVAVITDSCAPNVKSLDILRKDPKVSVGPKARAIGPRMANVIDDLFFKPGPGPGNPNAPAALIDINGAAEHQLAYGPADVGGFFTVGLADAIRANSLSFVDDTNGDGRLTWHEIFPKVIRNTEGQFDETNRKRTQQGLPPLEGHDGSPQKSQTPQAFRLPDPGPGHKFRYSVGVTGVGIAELGMKVVKVAPGSPAAGQLMEGDIVRSANGRSVRNFSDFAGIIDFAPTNRLELRVVRNNQVVDLTILMKQN